MKADLGVVKDTSTIYDKAIPQFEENWKSLYNLVMYLIHTGWSGEGAEKFVSRLNYFYEKQYKPLQKTLEVLNNTLKDVVEAKGQVLKQQCEQFANCFDGTASCFFTGEGYCQGVLSLEYDNVNPMVNIYDEIASQSSGFFRGSSSDLLSKKKTRLEDLGNDIKRQSWLSGRLEYSHLDISNEVAEALNNIKREEKALSTFIQSLQSYSSGLKNLEENTKKGLNEIQTVDKMVVMTGEEKAWQVAGKTVTNDIVGGGLTVVGGVGAISASYTAAPETSGASVIWGYVAGSSMIISGGNTFINGVTDLKYEWNYEWSEVGQHNFLVDVGGAFSKKIIGNENSGKQVGAVVSIATDSVASVYSVGEGIIKVPQDIKNISHVTNISNVTNVSSGVKSFDNLLRSDLIGNYYNYKTVMGDLSTTKDVFGLNSSNSNINNSIDYGNSQITISSIHPNNITIFNNGNPQLINKSGN